MGDFGEQILKSGRRVLTSCLADGNLKYTIFIYKHDKFRAGLPVYHINRYVGETGEMFEDGSNIIYVNGTYSGDDDPFSGTVYPLFKSASDGITAVVITEDNEAYVYIESEHDDDFSIVVKDGTWYNV